MRRQSLSQPALALLSLFILVNQGSAASRPPSLRKEIQQAQKTEGLSLLAVDKGAIWKLDFRTGNLIKITLLPREIAYFPGSDQNLTNYSLNWERQKLAGVGEKGLFVADLTARTVCWLGHISVERMALNHKGDKLAFVSDDRVCVLDLVKSKCKVVGGGVNGATLPQWSSDDTQLLFHNAQFEVVRVDLKRVAQYIIGKGRDATWSPAPSEVTLLGKRSIFASR